MSTPTTSTLAERLKSLRHSKQLRLNEVARSVGTTSSYLSRLESGVRTAFSREVGEKIAEFYGVSFSWLADGIESDPLKATTAHFYQAIAASGLEESAEIALSEISLWLRCLITGPASKSERAFDRVNEILKNFAAECASKNEPIRQASLKMAQARFSSLSVDTPENTDSLVLGMNERWEAILKRLVACIGSDSHASAAKSISISRQALHKYLHKKGIPNAESALRILDWVQDMESKKSGSAGAVTPTEARKRPKKTRKDELRSNPKKP